MAETQEIEAPVIDEQQEPPQSGDPAEKYYNYLKKVGADTPPTFDSFKKTLSDPKSAQQYYNYIRSKKYDAPPTFESFSKTLGVHSENTPVATTQPQQAPAPVPEHEIQHTSVHDIRHLQEMSSRPETQSYSAGATTVNAPDPEAIASNKAYRDQYEKQTQELSKTWGTDLDATKKALNDFPDEQDENKLKNFATLSKANPVIYGRLKDANDIRVGIAKSGEPDAANDAQVFNDAQTSNGYDQLVDHNIPIQKELIYKHGLGQKGIEQLKNTQSPLINTLDPGLLHKYWNGPDKELGLNPSQYAGLETERLFSPNKYQMDMGIIRNARGLDEAGKANPIDLSKQPYEYQRGVENVLYNLDKQGRENTARYIAGQKPQIEAQVNNLQAQYQAKINNAKTPQEQQALIQEFNSNPLIAEATKLEQGQDELKYDEINDQRKYPLNFADQATRAVRDAMDQTQGGVANTGKWFGNVLQGAGETADNTMRWIKNTAINIAGSEESKAFNNAKNIGHQSLNELSAYEPRSYTGVESPFKIPEDLTKNVQSVFNDPSLSDSEKQQKATALVRDNFDQLEVNPKAGQQNLTGKAAIFQAANVMGQILGVANQSFLLGGAIGDASKLQQVATAFTPMYMSTQNQMYEQALKNGDEHPLLKSNLDATIISLASLINPDIKVVKGMLGAESGLGKTITGISEDTWNKVLSTNKPILDRTIAAAKATGKQLGLANLQYGLIAPTAQYIAHKSILNEDANLGDMIKDGVIQTSLTMALPAVLHGAWGGIKAAKVNPTQKYAIVEAGLHPDLNIELIEGRIKSGQISEIQGHEMKQMVKHAGEILLNSEMIKTDGTPMNEKEVADTVYNMLRVRTLEGKLKNAAGPVKPIIEERIHELNKDIADLHTSESDKQKSELNQLLNDNLDRIKEKMPTMEGPIKDAIARNEPEEVYKEIASQALETTKVDGVEKSSRGLTEEIFGKAVVDKAIEISKQKEKPVEHPEDTGIQKQKHTVSSANIVNVKLKDNAAAPPTEPAGPPQESQRVGSENIPVSQEETPANGPIEQAGQQPSEATGKEVDEWPFKEEPFDLPVGIKKAISEAQRVDHSLPPVDLKTLGSDDEVLKAGKKAVDEGAINPREVAAKVIESPRTYTSEEAGAMLYYGHQLRVTEDDYHSQKAEAEDILSKDPNNTAAYYSKLTAEQKLGQLDDDIDAMTQANRINSRSWGDLGNIMQIETDQSFSPARVRTVIKDNYGGKIPGKIQEKLDRANAERDKAIADLKSAKEKIALQQLQKDAAKEKPAKEPKTVKERKESLKEERTKLIEDLKKALKKDAGSLSANPLPVNTIEAISKLALNYFKDGVLTIEGITDKIYDDLKGVVEGLDKKQVRDAVSTYRPLAREQATESAKKKATGLELTNEMLAARRKTNPDAKMEIQPKLAKLNFEKDTEYIKAKQRLINAEFKIKQEKLKSYMSKQSGLQKTAGWANRLMRLSILSGVKVLEKLAAAATIGSATMKIPEEVMNGIWGQTFPKIKAKADTDMGMNVMAVGKYYSEFFNPFKFIKDTKDIIRHGETSLGKELEQTPHDHIPILDLPTDLHQVIKGPPKRAMFQYALTKILDAEQKKGVDINHPLVLESARQRAFARAKYEIFMERNAVSRQFGKWEAKWQDEGKAGAAKSFLLRFAFPVSTVPTNIARRVGLSVAGLPIGLAKAAKAYHAGIENLSTEEANAIGKALTKGSLGIALWTAGFLGYKSMGGLYTKFDPNKQRKDETLSDELQLMNHPISKPWQHALPFEVMQLGATFRHIYEKTKEKESDPIAVAKATMGSAGAILEQIPVVETPINAVMATQDPYMAKKLGQDMERRVEPQLLKDVGIIKDDKKSKEKGTRSPAHR